jgi:hypothetical protein
LKDGRGREVNITFKVQGNHRILVVHTGGRYNRRDSDSRVIEFCSYNATTLVQAKRPGSSLPLCWLYRDYIWVTSGIASGLKIRELGKLKIPH